MAALIPSALRTALSGLMAALILQNLAAKPPGTGKIEFSERGGLCRDAVMLRISAGDGGTILFTTNGAVPTPANSIQYTGPLRVASTTILRAVSKTAGNGPGPEALLSLIFPAEVLRQNGAGFPRSWGATNGQPVVADYEMDPEIVNDPACRGEMIAALTGLPSLSLVLDPADLFESARGIYSHPEESGDAWERSVAIEWLPGDAQSGFRATAGLRIQGGWNRRPEESPKHSFRIVFRKQYGQARLKQPLFGDGVREFDCLVLRGGNNHSWLHWSAAERRSADYLRDEWMRESYAAMGQTSARGRFVHLYLNGLYWGIYNLTERPDAHFAAAHFGGSAADYDARNADKVLSGDDAVWKKMFALANAGVTNRAQFEAISELLEVPAFCDYLLLNLYAANGDWDAASNWYALRRRSPPGRFIFFVWDGERTLEGLEDNRLNDDDDFSPTRLFQKLRACPEFRAEFTRRAREHLSGHGALAPGPAAARFRRLAELLDVPILAESARWGDYRRDVHPYKEGPYELYTRDLHWRPEIRRILENYFPNRSRIFGEQLKGF